MKIQCVCGERISLSNDFNPNEFYVVGEVWLEDIVEEIKALCRGDDGKKELSSLGLGLYKLFRRRNPPLPYLLECPHCLRLLVFPSSSDLSIEKMRSYVPETNSAGTIHKLRDYFTDATKES